MRDLEQYELTTVGGGCSPCPPSEPTQPSRRGPQGNNGFGNGADSNLAAPGNSGSTGGGKEGSIGDERRAR